MLKAAFSRVVAAFASALRRAGSAISTGMSWMDDAWETVSDSPFGQAAGYVWSAAKLPVIAAGSLIGLDLSTDRDFQRLDKATTAVGRVGLAVGRGVMGAGIGAARVAGAAVADVAAIPSKLISAFTGGQQSTPQKAAASAEERATAEQAKADYASDARVTLAALRRVASSVARSSRPDPADLEALPPGLAGYLVKLSPDEADILLRARTNVLRGLISTGVAPDGVRTPKEVGHKSDEPVIDSKTDFMARLAAKRATETEALLDARAVRAA